MENLETCRVLTNRPAIGGGLQIRRFFLAFHLIKPLGNLRRNVLLNWPGILLFGITSAKGCSRQLVLGVGRGRSGEGGRIGPCQKT